MTLTFPAVTDDTPRLPGCRLQSIEVRNWGTFDRTVWRFNVDGHNALLTGDIGSGKSTLVDAITTLLLPASRISYNKAAGAAAKERDLRSYVQGFYKQERDEMTGATRPVGLRGVNDVSVIIGVWGNVDFDLTVSLAQVFHCPDLSAGQPERLYVVADGVLTVAEHFTGFESLRDLKRRFGHSEHVKAYTTFPDYGRDFRRRLGIESEQSMNLFHQTVSMKAVDNLNEFVRNHMLEPGEDIPGRIKDLIAHFDDLTRAHDSVVKAREQLDTLRPLIVDLDHWDQAKADQDAAEAQQHAVPFFFAHRAHQARSDELEAIQYQRQELAGQDKQLERQVGAVEQTVARLEAQIAGQGGDRLKAIEERLSAIEPQVPDRRSALNDFNDRLAQVGLGPVSTAEQFAAAHANVDARRRAFEDAEETLDTQISEATIALTDTQRELNEVSEELRSLRERTTNVPSRSLALRSQMCSDLNLPAGEIVFAGELLQVRDDASEWEGAAERLLHGFALSMLVPEGLYPQVAQWIDRHHLNLRVVYFRVPRAAPVRLDPDRRSNRPLLVDMLAVKPDSPFAGWLRSEIARRADHVCVASTADFPGERRAVTRAGQIKDRDRHEKDDRRRIDDRSQYVLGWSNQAKTDALTAHRHQLDERLRQHKGTYDQAKARRAALKERMQALWRIAAVTTWDSLDYEALVHEVTDLHAEHQRITSTSDVLNQLTQERDRQRDTAKQLKEDQTRLVKKSGALDHAEDQAKTALAATEQRLADTAGLQKAEPHFPALTDLVAAAPDEHAAADHVHQAITKELQRAGGNINHYGARVIRAMAAYKDRYPLETADLDASPDAGREFRELHDKVANDDLPRFEAEFKDYLNKNAIRDLAGFANRLERQETTIRDRVNVINRSLADIDYNPGRYIRLVPDRSPSPDIRTFREDLRACVQGSVNDTDLYSEARFVQVKTLIDRFRGREGLSDADQAWTRRVTDVRQWFVFSASERYRDTDTEYESYTDSAGKSGGQKEKLAYTVLAASLAYQFGLDWNAGKSKAFRFVVIDEAFGRGSDVSTRYALDLFTRLGLQLLIVTPMQKIKVIEPHVSCVGFVDNPAGNYSRVHNMTVEEVRDLWNRKHSPGAPTAVQGPAA